MAAMLESVVRAGAGLTGFIWSFGWTVSHHVDDVGTDVMGPVGGDVAPRVGVGVDPSARAGYRFGTGSGFGINFRFGTAIVVRCLAGRTCWRYSSVLGPPVCVSSAYLEASRPPPLVFAFLSLSGPVPSQPPLLREFPCGPFPTIRHPAGTRPAYCPYLPPALSFFATAPPAVQCASPACLPNL